MNSKIINVLVVDDSALVRDMLSHIINSHTELNVIGVAKDPFEARQAIKSLRPDVISLDIEMPRMNGVTFLENLMRLNPLPVVMVSTLTAKGASVTLDALALGAVDFIEKPKDIQQVLGVFAQQLNDKLLAAASVPKLSLLAVQTRLTLDSPKPRHSVMVSKTENAAHKIALIGGSTGALEALKHILTHCNFDGTECFVVCLHLPGEFTRSYAQRLDQLLPLTVKQASHNEVIKQGHVYIAPGTRHLTVKRIHGQWRAWLDDSDRVSGHKPSVDVLFNSFSKHNVDGLCAVILTGMGKDGARGMLNLQAAGAITYAQDQESSIVWGMPSAAIKLGGIHQICPLDNIASQLNQYFKQTTITCL